MEALPDLILDYLQENVSDRLSPACLCVNAKGELLGWSGAVEIYPLPELQCGLNVESFVPLLVGLGEVLDPLVFSLVNLTEDCIVNLHILPRTAGGLYVLLLDATDEHRSKQVYQQKANEVQLLNARLKKVLAQLEKAQAELRKKKAEAEEASRLKSRFIAGMSHEFRTPLTSILGYTEMLQRGMLTSEQLASATQSISSGAQHLMSLIDNVLDQARFEAGEMALHVETVNLAAVVQDIKAMFSPLAEQKGLAFIVQSGFQGDCWVKVDGMRLRQLMINLCNNAIKYTDQGQVQISCAYEHGCFEFSVKDTGPGIEEVEQQAIFNAFHRVQTQSAKAGAGLGLAISRQILEIMGGGLSLHSQVGEGSEFSLNIPVELVDAGSDPRVDYGEVKEASATVLVAEDNLDVVQMVELFLQSSGFNVLLAGTGKEALDLALSEQPDLVLMDMNMPIMSGSEAVAELRNKGYEKPILALSASPAPQDKQRALDVGCNSYLLKPVAMDELISSIFEFLGEGSD